MKTGALKSKGPWRLLPLFNNQDSDVGKLLDMVFDPGSRSDSCTATAGETGQ
jgi:hypothetical protein